MSLEQLDSFLMCFPTVLLANVSALSAIGYLRKYVKVEAAAAEKKKPQLKALSES